MDSLELIVISKILELPDLTELAVWQLEKDSVVYLCIRDKAKPKLNPKQTGDSENPVVGFYIARKADFEEAYLINATVDMDDILAKIEGNQIETYPIPDRRLAVVKSDWGEVAKWVGEIQEMMGVKR